MRSVPSTSWLVALLAFAPLLAWIAPALFGGPVGATAVWNLGVVVCFAGWGGWVARRLAPRVDVDLGLRAAWGLALTTTYCSRRRSGWVNWAWCAFT